MIIRKANKKQDYDPVWDIFSRVIQSGDTYVFDPSTSKESLEKYWFADYMETFVVVVDEIIAGTYIIKPNQIDLGNHIANCSYMVSPEYQRRGIGKILAGHSIQFAKDQGYKGIQFNFVVSTNTPAIELWKKVGFKITGTNPNSFRHRESGLVDTFVMYKDLQA